MHSFDFLRSFDPVSLESFQISDSAGRILGQPSKILLGSIQDSSRILWQCPCRGPFKITWSWRNRSKFDTLLPFLPDSSSKDSSSKDSSSKDSSSKDSFSKDSSSKDSSSKDSSSKDSSSSDSFQQKNKQQQTKQQQQHQQQRQQQQKKSQESLASYWWVYQDSAAFFQDSPAVPARILGSLSRSPIIRPTDGVASDHQRRVGQAREDQSRRPEAARGGTSPQQGNQGKRARGFSTILSRFSPILNHQPY